MAVVDLSLSIPPISPLYLPHISPISPLYLPYISKVAVVDLSLSIGRAECFGLLGPNGAGKTTTLSILTGDHLPSAGRAWIDGCDVVSELSAVRRRLGYCPQQDPLLDPRTCPVSRPVISSLYLPISPYISHISPTPPCISPYLRISPGRTRSSS